MTQSPTIESLQLQLKRLEQECNAYYVAWQEEKKLRHRLEFELAKKYNEGGSWP